MASAYFILKMIRRRRAIKAKEKQKLTSNNSDEELKCRICLNKGKIPIYGGERYPDISASVCLFGDIQVEADDEFPKYLCDICFGFLKNAVEFRKLATESDNILRLNLQKLERAPEPEPSDADLFIHDSESHDEQTTQTTWFCKLCKVRLGTWDDYIAHKISREHKNIRIQCRICRGLFTVQLYERHLARHQSESHLICEVCGKMYRKDNLMRHLLLHSFELPFKCKLCPYRGRYLDSLKIHLRTHTGDKPFSCDKCELRFLTRSNLNRHLLTHKKERPFKCVECGRGFYTNRDLDVHFKSDHVGIKDFGCKVCGNKYGTRKALMRHELRVHKRNKMAKGRLPLYLQAEYRKSVDGV